MIFPTLEGLTAGEQEIHEAAQLRSRGCVGPLSPNATKGPGKRQVGDAFRAQARQLLERLQPGGEYSARDIFQQCTQKDYLFLKRMADAGMVIRTGTFHHYRYSKPAEQDLLEASA